MKNYYTYGNFTYGHGKYGYGPALEEQQDTSMIKYGVANTLYLSLVTYGDVDFIVDPVIEAGDVKVQIDGSSVNNITTLPTVSPSGSTTVKIQLSAAESTGKIIKVLFKDQTNPPAWNDKDIYLDTYGDSNGTVAFDFTNNSNLNSTVSNKSIIAQSIVEIPVSGTISGSIESNAVNRSNATNGYIFGVSGITENIDAVTSNISFSGSNVNVRVNDKGILNDITVADILNGNVDGMTMQMALTRLMSYAIGKVEHDGHGVFTYYLQDSMTSAFVLSGTTTERTRTG